MMVVRVGGEGQIGNHRTEVQHRRELNAKLARRMDSDAQLECLTDRRGFDAGADAAPERRVEQHDVDGGLQHVRGQLLEVHNDSVRRQRHAQLLSRATHPVHAEHRILEVVVLQILDVLAEPDRLLGGPDAVRVETKAITGKRGGDRAVALELELRWKHATLQLVRRESVRRLERERLGDELVARSYFARSVGRAWITEEQIRCERNVIAQSSADDVADRNTPRLTQNVETCELQRGQHLRAIVVQRRSWISDAKAHLLEPRRIVAEDVWLES